MKDLFTVLAVVIVVAGLWTAIPVFGALVGTGLGIIFLYLVINSEEDT